MVQLFLPPYQSTSPPCSNSHSFLMILCLAEVLLVFEREWLGSLKSSWLIAFLLFHVDQIKSLQFTSWWVENGEKNNIIIIYRLDGQPHEIIIKDTKYYVKELYSADKRNTAQLACWDLYVGAAIDIFGKATVLKQADLKTSEWNKFYASFLTEVSYLGAPPLTTDWFTLCHRWRTHSSRSSRSMSVGHSTLGWPKPIKLHNRRRHTWESSSFRSVLWNSACLAIDHCFQTILLWPLRVSYDVLSLCDSTKLQMNFLCIYQ